MDILDIMTVIPKLLIGQQHGMKNLLWRSNRYAAQLAGAPACGAGEESSNLSDLILKYYSLLAQRQSAELLTRMSGFRNSHRELAEHSVQW